MKTSFVIRLSQVEDRQLRLAVRRQRGAHREVVRAKLILMLSRGASFSEVARRVGVARRIVYKWAKRFAEKRLAGLQDQAGRGRQARFPPDRVNVLGEAGLRAT